MWQTKYALAVPKNLGLGLNFFVRAVKAISSLGVRNPWWVPSQLWNGGDFSQAFFDIILGPTTLSF
jgi:hypothetical protein